MDGGPLRLIGEIDKALAESRKQEKTGFADAPAYPELVQGNLPDDLERIVRGKKGKYIIQGEIGKGGQGVVYWATDEQGIVVAVKKVEIKQDREWAELKRHREITSSFPPEINDVLIANLIDSEGEDDAVHVRLVQQYVPEMNLEEERNNPDIVVVTKEQAVDRAITLARAFHEFHTDSQYEFYGRKLVHRDINPRNIRVAGERLGVVDFGITRQRTKDSGTVTRTWVTDGYTAPEVVHGEVTPQSDAYSLTATLAFMLTGNHPYTKLNRSTGVPELTCEGLEHIDEQLVEIVKKGTHAALDKRHDDMAKLADDLEAWRNGEYDQKKSTWEHFITTRKFAERYGGTVEGFNKGADLYEWIAAGVSYGLWRGFSLAARPFKQLKDKPKYAIFKPWEEERTWDIVDETVAEILETNYSVPDHMAVPGHLMARALADALDLDKKELKRIQKYAKKKGNESIVNLMHGTVIAGHDKESLMQTLEGKTLLAENERLRKKIEVQLGITSSLTGGIAGLVAATAGVIAYTQVVGLDFLHYTFNNKNVLYTYLASCALGASVPWLKRAADYVKSYKISKIEHQALVGAGAFIGLAVGAATLVWTGDSLGLSKAAALAASGGASLVSGALAYSGLRMSNGERQLEEVIETEPKKPWYKRAADWIEGNYITGAIGGGLSFGGATVAASKIAAIIANHPFPTSSTVAAATLTTIIGAAAGVALIHSTKRNTTHESNYANKPWTQEEMQAYKPDPSFEHVYAELGIHEKRPDLREKELVKMLCSEGQAEEIHNYITEQPRYEGIHILEQLAIRHVLGEDKAMLPEPVE